jgi:hypothetical protein
MSGVSQPELREVRWPTYAKASVGSPPSAAAQRGVVGGESFELPTLSV